jgi:hypothetical protein
MCSMPDRSRIDEGRGRAASAKRAVTLAAAGGFLVALALVRHAHPGAAATSNSRLSPPAALSSEVQQGLSLGGGSIAPAGGSSEAAPQVQSSTS